MSQYTVTLSVSCDTTQAVADTVTRLRPHLAELLRADGVSDATLNFDRTNGAFILTIDPPVLAADTVRATA